MADQGYIETITLEVQMEAVFSPEEAAKLVDLASRSNDQTRQLRIVTEDILPAFWENMKAQCEADWERFVRLMDSGDGILAIVPMPAGIRNLGWMILLEILRTAGWELPDLKDGDPINGQLVFRVRRKAKTAQTDA
jgi:hypothetical protein